MRFSLVLTMAVNVTDFARTRGNQPCRANSCNNSVFGIRPVKKLRAGWSCRWTTTIACDRVPLGLSFFGLVVGDWRVKVSDAKLDAGREFHCFSVGGLDSRRPLRFTAV